jgi:hypothetical protein
MPYFANPFDQEFRGNWLLEDVQYSIAFSVPANTNRSDLMYAWNPEPYNFTVHGSILSINYAYDLNMKNYSNLQIDVAGLSPAATTATEVAAKLNANAIFTDNFQAYTQNSSRGTVDFGPLQTVVIKTTKRAKQSIRVYIDNTGAESAIFFNQKVGVAQLPSYFARHTIANRFTYPDSCGMLVQLDPTIPTDAQVITAAGQNPSIVLADWQLLRGRSLAFPFQKNTYTGTQLTFSINYNAGAQAGDAATKTEYTYDGSGNILTKVTIPYVLTSGDLITPF